MTDSVGDCSISLRFITDFDHVTLDVQGHMSKVKVTAWKRRWIVKLLLRFEKSGYRGR